MFVYWLFMLVSAVEREVRFWLMQLALLMPYDAFLFGFIFSW